MQREKQSGGLARVFSFCHKHYILEKTRKIKVSVFTLYRFPKWEEQHVKQLLNQVIYGGFYRLTVDGDTVHFLLTDKERRPVTEMQLLSVTFVV